ncbi:MAG: hypothetical protein FWF22_10630 [Treponema sp.]|nr:hypothetical protein [Treponema sp.]
MGHFKRAEKKTGFVRIAIMILIFFGLVAVTFSLLRPLEITVRSGITGLRDNFIQQVKDFTGLQLEYSTANPSFLGSLDINNIRLLRPDSSLFLSISRLRLYFSFWDLISGKINLGVHSVSIDKPVLSYDSEKDARLYDLVSGGGLISNPGAPSYSLIPNDLQLRIRSGECDILNGNVSAKMLNFNLDGNIHDNRIVFNARLGAQGSVNSLLNGSMNARGNGDFNLKNMEGNATLNIPAFSGDSFRLQPLSVSFLLKNGKLEIRKIYDRLPLDISAVWDTQTGALSCSLVADNFSPRDLITLTGPLKNYNTYMAARLSGKAGLENGENGFDYTIEANAAQDSLKNLPGRTSIEISADGNGKAITFRNLLFSSSMGTVHFNGIVGLEPFAPDGMLSFSDINLQKNSTGKTLNGLFDIKSSGQDIDVLATYINCGGTELSDLNLNISMEKEGLTFQCSADSLESADSADDGQQPSGSFFLEGSMDYNPGRIQASLKLDSFSAGSMLSLADPFVDIPQIPDLVRSTADDILVTTEVFFTTDYEHILYNAPALSIIYEGRQKLEADASLSGTDRRFELDQ